MFYHRLTTASRVCNILRTGRGNPRFPEPDSMIGWRTCATLGSVANVDDS
jgi:hypothetical protein